MVYCKRVLVLLGPSPYSFFLLRCATEDGCDELRIASSSDYEQNRHVFSGPSSRWIDVEIPGLCSVNRSSKE